MTASEFDLSSMMHSLRLAEIRVKAAVFTAFETADIWITISSQLRPSSSIRATAPNWPWARFMRFEIAAICSWSDKTCVAFLVAISSYSDQFQQRRLTLLLHARHNQTKLLSYKLRKLPVNTSSLLLNMRATSTL